MLGLVVVLALAAVVRSQVVQVFVIPSTSMEPTLRVDDRVAVSRWGGSFVPARGDVVVFDGTGLFTESETRRGLVVRLEDAAGALVGRSSRTMYVKRVIGLPGERITCCTQGRLLVDGRPLDEPWLPAGVTPSKLVFDVRVPDGAYMMLGDNRDISADSRAHLGSPGGGMVPRGRIVGPVVAVVWPPSRWGDPTEDGDPSGAAARPDQAFPRSTTP